MSLTNYNQKRDFSRTPEPKGTQKKTGPALHFVIQKHDASTLHYDFRLEMNGVLKSWAIPKGPSLNPADKRLAMEVEDHPFDYRNFEGTIPEGNYGAGTVIVWDEGVYEPAGVAGLPKEEQEKTLLRQLFSGNLKFVLNGHKIKGEFSLIRLKKGDGTSWLLIKKADDFATEADVTTDERSVLSGRTIAEVAAEEGGSIRHPQKKKEAPVKAGGRKAAKTTKVSQEEVPVNKEIKGLDLSKLLGKHFSLIRPAAMPHEVAPMLARLVDAPFSNKDWLYEIKWDGYRALAYLDNGYFDLLSRNNKSFLLRYPPVAAALKKLGIRAVLDGEVTAINEEGMADFQLLQSWQTTGAGHLKYYVFDILWLEGYDLTGLPLVERKKILQKLLPASDELIQYSDHVLADGEQFFEVAVQKGLEGIMAKKAGSTYEPGERSDNWLKIKVSRRQEVVIAGFTEPRNSRKFFGALLLGVYQDGELIYVGHTGSGFNRKSLEDVWKKLLPLVSETCPFAREPKTNMPATWVKPELVCEIKFTEWTKDLQARHPIFQGLREDKDAPEVRIERSEHSEELVGKGKAVKKPAAAKGASKEKAPSVKKVKANRKAAEDLLDLSNGKDQQVMVNRKELTFTNLDKYYWKKEKITKGDMVNYYARIAPFILPYLKDRPQSLHRYPNGIEGSRFFQKEVKGKVPDWIRTHVDFSESTGKPVNYLVCRDEASLLYMANLGCIEMHPWHSRAQHPEWPDYCLIDLDPDTDNTFAQVMDVARVLKDLLDELKVPAYCKTSGSTGMHIYIPLGAKYAYEQSRQLAELLVNLLQKELPQLTSVERSPRKRKGKIYLDFLQNSQTQTVAAPYSLRPKPGAPVSTPLDWSELRKGLKPTTYNIRNIHDRLREVGDLFAPVLKKGINLERVIKKIESLIY